MRLPILLSLALSLAACTVPPPPEAQAPRPVTRAAGDISGIQSRVFDVPAGAPFTRALLGTLQDRGFRLSSMEPGGRVVATRLGNLQITVSWRPEGTGATRVTVDALVMGVDRSSTQVDAPEYYERDVFAPLATRLRATARRV